MKYPEWQEEYLAAILEGNVTRLPEKVFEAEAAIFNRYQALTNLHGKGHAEERAALEIAVEGLRVLKTKRLNHPDWA